MHIFTEALTLSQFLSVVKKQGKMIGFIPTMGALHEGHLSLVRTAKAQCDVTVVSIFVNPTQFGPKEDLEHYPRTLEQDQNLLKAEGVDCLFFPSEKEIYPFGKHDATRVEVPQLSKQACGKSRPHHFRGVTMVVNRLLNVVQPDKAYFGEKDFQQYVIIQRMVSDLLMPVTIVACPIVREVDGLALSSRNRYLSSSERHTAASIFKGLSEAKKIFSEGESRVRVLCQRVVKTVPLLKIDYVVCVDPLSFQKKTKVSVGDRLLFAGYLGKTRLIDNVAL